MSSEWKSLNLLISTRKKEIAKYNQLKRKELAPLIKRQEQLKKELWEYMSRNELTTYNGISIESVQPKKPRGKKEKEEITREEQLAKLRAMGIRNPDAALEELGI